MTDPHLEGPTLGRVRTEPALARPDLLADPVRTALASWSHADAVGVLAIDPQIADTAVFNDHFGTSPQASANCVIVLGRRAGEERVAACVVRGDTRADVNGAVRRLLEARKASFLPHERAVAESAMEHGGITPIGLPESWRLLIDSRVVDIDVAIIGSGLRASKALIPGRLLADLPGAEVIEGLATPAT